MSYRDKYLPTSDSDSDNGDGPHWSSLKVRKDVHSLMKELERLSVYEIAKNAENLGGVDLASAWFNEALDSKYDDKDQDIVKEVFMTPTRRCRKPSSENLDISDGCRRVLYHVEDRKVLQNIPDEQENSEGKSPQEVATGLEKTSEEKAILVLEGETYEKDMENFE
jgi:hypothetical protein